jgi:hypothetical protein
LHGDDKPKNSTEMAYWKIGKIRQKF